MMVDLANMRIPISNCLDIANSHVKGTSLHCVIVSYFFEILKYKDHSFCFRVSWDKS